MSTAVKSQAGLSNMRSVKEYTIPAFTLAMNRGAKEGAPTRVPQVQRARLSTILFVSIVSRCSLTHCQCDPILSIQNASQSSSRFYAFIPPPVLLPERTPDHVQMLDR